MNVFHLTRVRVFSRREEQPSLPPVSVSVLRTLSWKVDAHIAAKSFLDRYCLRFPTLRYTVLTAQDIRVAKGSVRKAPVSHVEYVCGRLSLD